jgi:solute carrier family 36 (proton-coupled amino acid transporter)
MAVPNLGPMISLVGAICFSNLGLLCPAIIEIVAYYEEKQRLRFWKNIFIIAFGLLALVSGTYASIVEIIAAY